MKFEDAKKEISKIARLENGNEALHQVRNLDERINRPKIQKRLQGNYLYFYIVQIEYRSEVKHTREKIVGTLGRIEKQKYLENKKIIDALQREGNKQELTKWLEQY
jgi:tRNA nucleotidyltransferase/poly(A) polymerase